MPMQYRPRDCANSNGMRYGIERCRYDGRYFALFGDDGRLVLFDTAAERDTELARLNGAPPAPEPEPEPAPARSKKITA